MYGAGQAKLALLKLEEAKEEPRSISSSSLEMLANEDLWEEFVPIDLGHWAGSNLRDISMKAGVKEDYDRYYGWTSMFSHGHWPAVRDVSYDTCGNPLHRLHRIPRAEARAMPDVVEDGVEIMDKILSLLDAIYPPFQDRLGGGTASGSS